MYQAHVVIILWPLELLLRNDCEISKYIRAVSRQRLGKRVPEETNKHAPIDVLLETGSFWVVGAEIL
jgi:hypothetical protein